MNTLLLLLAKRPIYFRGLAYFWLILTCFLLFKPSLGVDNYLLFNGEDKVAHFILFFNLSLLWALNFKYAVHLHPRFIYKIIVALGVTFAILSELIQDFLPSRSMDIDDVIFDIIGISLGVLMFFLIENRLNTGKIS